MATLALVGATGGIGSQVLEQALASGLAVRALARTPQNIQPHEGLTVIQGDVREREPVTSVIQGADFVISCLGTRRFTTPVVAEGTRMIVTVMEASNVERLAMISSVGIGDSRRQGKRISRVFMHLVVPVILREQYWELEEAESAVRSSGIRGTVIRPVGLTNGKRTGGVRGVSANSRDTTSFVSRADVADFLVRWTTDTRWDGQAVTVVGPKK